LATENLNVTTKFNINQIAVIAQNECYAIGFLKLHKMKEQLIKFETSVLAKQKGFDIDCELFYITKDRPPMGYNLSAKESLSDNPQYNKYILVPTQSLLQKWLREVHNIDAFVVACYIGEDKHRYSYYITHPTDTDSDGCEALTYEEALEQALYECLHIVSETVA